MRSRAVGRHSVDKVPAVDRVGCCRLSWRVRSIRDTKREARKKKRAQSLRRRRVSRTPTSLADNSLFFVEKGRAGLGWSSPRKNPAEVLAMAGARAWKEKRTRWMVRLSFSLFGLLVKAIQRGRAIRGRVCTRMSVPYMHRGTFFLSPSALCGSLVRQRARRSVSLAEHLGCARSCRVRGRLSPKENKKTGKHTHQHTHTKEKENSHMSIERPFRLLPPPPSPYKQREDNIKKNKATRRRESQRPLAVSCNASLTNRGQQRRQRLAQGTPTPRGAATERAGHTL
jgi:hypothetical protein